MNMPYLPLNRKLLNISHNGDSTSNFPVRTYSHLSTCIHQYYNETNGRNLHVL